MVSIIVAIANDSLIGNNNELLWHITEDMRYFRKVTSGHAVIMGRKTYDSIGRPLPKRHNIVITRQNIAIEGCSVAHSLKEALAIAGEEDEVFIIGGAEIYSLSLPIANRLYITRVGGHFKGDTHFPEWDQTTWQLHHEEKFDRGEEFEHPFSFELYERL
ncbi:MAG: dihydrofolate reductase [Rikenellaceae bacterium]